MPWILPDNVVRSNYLDRLNAPFASVKIFYRPRGTSIYLAHLLRLAKCFLLELLMAEGLITRYGAGAGIGGGESDANDRKRAREDSSPGPFTKRRSGSTVKKEEMSADAYGQQIRALQVSRVDYSILQRCRA